MRRDAVDCDICGERDLKTSQSLYFTIDRFVDAAGDSDTDQRRIDFCDNCIPQDISKMKIRSMSMDEQHALYHSLLKKKIDDKTLKTLKTLRCDPL